MSSDAIPFWSASAEGVRIIRMKSLISTAIAAILLFVSLVPALADDDLEEFGEEIEELFEELDEELDELLEEFQDSDEDFNELVEKFNEEFEEFQELAEEFQELATPFAGPEVAFFMGIPQKMWVVDGILHIRGQPVLTSFVGTVGSTVATWANTVVANLNINLATGDGVAFLSSVIDLTSGDLRGTFETRGTFEITAGAILLKFVGLGDGDFEGMIIMATAAGAGDTLVHEGIILDLDDDDEEEEALEEFADLVEEFDDLVGEFEDFGGESDDFVAEVLENPAEFDEKFAELAEEFQEYVDEFDEVFDELAEEFAQFATPASGNVFVTLGAPTEVLIVDGNLIISQPFSLILTGTVDGTEVGTLRIVIKVSTGEFILQAMGVFTGTVDGKSGTAVDRTVIMGGPGLPDTGKGILIGITGDLVNVHELDKPEGDGFTGLTFDL